MLAAQYELGDVLFWGGLLLGAVVVLSIAVWGVRRWTIGGDVSTEADDIWSLQHLRELRASGQITDAEFERLKSQVVAQFKTSDREVSD